MSILHTAHLMLVSVWLGIVLAETALELLGRVPEHAAFTARVHYWIDLCFEVPVVVLVLVTGILLLGQALPLTNLLLVKILLALVAIAANFICAGLVFFRKRLLASPEGLSRMTRRITLTWLAVPFGLGALIMGLKYFHFR